VVVLVAFTLLVFPAGALAKKQSSVVVLAVAV
jgi:hypothetical protein